MPDINRAFGAIQNALMTKLEVERQRKDRQRNFLSGLTSLIGTGVGAVVGGPTGAAIGGGVGQTLGGAISGSGAQTFAGARSLLGGLMSAGQESKAKKQQQQTQETLGKLFPGTPPFVGPTAGEMTGQVPAGRAGTTDDPETQRLLLELSGIAPGQARLAGQFLTPAVEEPSEFTLSPGEQRFRGDELIAEGPPKKTTPTKVSLALEVAGGDAKKALKLLNDQSKAPSFNRVLTLQEKRNKLLDRIQQINNDPLLGPSEKDVRAIDLNAQVDGIDKELSKLMRSFDTSAQSDFDIMDVR